MCEHVCEHDVIFILFKKPTGKEKERKGEKKNETENNKKTSEIEQPFQRGGSEVAVGGGRETNH